MIPIILFIFLYSIVNVVGCLQGFRKIDTDKWEFANEDFQRGKRHLLKNIHRRKSSQVSQVGHHVGPSVEMGKSGVEGELEKLRKDKSLLMQEVMQLRHEHHVTAQLVDTMNQQLLAAEQKQKQMVLFFAKVFQNPVFLDHLQSQKEQREGTSSRVKRKFLKQQQAGPSNLGSSVEKEIVRYEPRWSDATTPTATKELESDAHQKLLDHHLQEMVGKLEIDAVAGQQTRTGTEGSDEFEQEQVEASHQIGMGMPGFPTMDPNEVLFKGKNVVSSQSDSSPGGSGYFISFPEDLSPDKMTPAIMSTEAEAENVIKQEDIWSMGFHSCGSHPSSSYDVWGNYFGSDIQELEVSAGLCNLWDLGAEQPEEGSGIDKWADDAPSIDDLEKPSSQFKEDDSKKMDP